MQLALKEPFFQKKKIAQRMGAKPPDLFCDTFDLKYFAYHVSKLKQFWKTF